MEEEPEMSKSENILDKREKKCNSGQSRTAAALVELVKI